MRPMLSCIASTILFLLSALYTSAASLRVAPTNLELIAPDSAAVLNLTNDGDHPINVQVRVVKWSQTDGAEDLEPTTDVVASPPAHQMSPHAEYVVRIVRTSKAPVRKEETYRIIVDELPDLSRAKAGAVTLSLRHSVPVFVRNPDAKAPDVTWNLSRRGGSLFLTCTNNGGSRFRLSNVILKQGATKIGGRSGLVGYVLAGATMQWRLDSAKSLSSGSVTLQGQSDLGRFDANISFQ
ncbi:fimbria/pilus periplasmic chaperone [Rhizobium leguminosarum]|uniref:Fimbria/pilus periplasmic chaperone n=1 Tax=Rhizobium ruizarguesonis TaxID=2081791 RepID=A0AAE5C6M3_9HYPH|nr:molecular chaperone [Rhizobium ruizarguesonis]NEI52421.1 fimbria/pilus periplasmic chaperone [Rhizobium ruizarguesonis]